MLGIPTASTSGPLRPSRPPRAVVFSGRARERDRWRPGSHRQPAYRMSHQHKRTCGDRAGRIRLKVTEDVDRFPALCDTLDLIGASPACGAIPAPPRSVRDVATR
jgi:hypothetical protein